MAVDLKSELSRPLALILAALAALGWVLLGLSSWSNASVQKAQRLQIMEVTEKNEKLGTDLAKQVAAAGALGDLESKLASTRDDLSRMSKAKSDAQAELTSAQRDLQTKRRDLTELDRNVQNQSQKLTELQTTSVESSTGQAAAEPEVRSSRGYRRGGRWSRRGRSYRSYSIISRSR